MHAHLLELCFTLCGGYRVTSDCWISLTDNSRFCKYLSQRLEFIVLQSVNTLKLLEKKVILLLQRLRFRWALADVK
jgi:hypothetical protein